MRHAILLFPLALAACGGSAPSPAVVALQTAGANPTTITVMGGTQLQFVNSDVVDHRVGSSDCAELASPALGPGASFTATVGAGPKTCSFDDALQPSAASFQGTVVVQGSSYTNPYGP